jgi:threonine synthase
MQLYSTNNPKLRVDLKEAVMNSLPADRGLYMPLHIPRFEPTFFHNLGDQSFQEIAFAISTALIKDYIPAEVLSEIVEEAINFPAPVQWLQEDIGVLELFHGPSLAFKDFGARFMSRLMSYFNRNENRPLTILVATSGDTGGAVAAGFYDTPGIEVVILYPSGKVSNLQEKQLTTLGKNIFACEVEGTFDDCQAMVKRAFLDDQLKEKYRLSSANSINIARLIPQSFYYFEAFKQIKDKNGPVVFSVPSGNFGNLTAGLMAKKMGLPIDAFIAATNINKIVPDYLKSGDYQPQSSIPTISNAMDVGNPSNFSRMMDLYGSMWEEVKKDIVGYFYDDDQTKKGITEIDRKFGYTADPHGAIGYLALQAYQTKHPCTGIFFETAHPGKFLPTVEGVLDRKIDIPESLSKLTHLEKTAHKMSNKYMDFKSFLLGR